MKMTKLWFLYNEPSFYTCPRFKLDLPPHSFTATTTDPKVKLKNNVTTTKTSEDKLIVALNNLGGSSKHWNEFLGFGVGIIRV